MLLLCVGTFKGHATTRKICCMVVVCYDLGPVLSVLTLQDASFIFFFLQHLASPDVQRHQTFKKRHVPYYFCA